MPDPLVLLADIALPEADAVSAELMERLGGFHVVLVGWFEVPEQTTAEQARDQFGDEMEEALQATAGRMRAAGAAVETRLVFTDDHLQTMKRLNEEVDRDVVLLAHPHEGLKRILVPIRALPHARRIAQVAARLAGDGASMLTLLRVQAKDEDDEGVLAVIVDELAAAGVPEEAITIEQLTADDPTPPILEQARQHDLVVMGASTPSTREGLFGAIPERMASDASVPVMVVSPRPEDASAAT